MNMQKLSIDIQVNHCINNLIKMHTKQHKYVQLWPYCIVLYSLTTIACKVNIVTSLATAIIASAIGKGKIKGMNKNLTKELSRMIKYECKASSNEYKCFCFALLSSILALNLPQNFYFSSNTHFFNVYYLQACKKMFILKDFCDACGAYLMMKKSLYFQK